MLIITLVVDLVFLLPKLEPADVLIQRRTHNKRNLKHHCYKEKLGLSRLSILSSINTLKLMEDNFKAWESARCSFLQDINRIKGCLINDSVSLPLSAALSRRICSEKVLDFNSLMLLFQVSIKLRV